MAINIGDIITLNIDGYTTNYGTKITLRCDYKDKNMMKMTGNSIKYSGNQRGGVYSGVLLQDDHGCRYEVLDTDYYIRDDGAVQVSAVWIAPLNS